MRNVITALIVFVGLQVTAQIQENITTVVLNAEDFIAYVADNYPAQQGQQLYLLVETSPQGIAHEHRFYIEQGLKLLSTRLENTDEIGIGTYGAVKANVLPLTKIEKEDELRLGLKNLFNGNFATRNQEGIVMAYDLIKDNQNPAYESTIVMLTGTGSDTMVATSKQSNTAYSGLENSSQGNSAAVETPAPVSKSSSRAEARQQRKQAKAAQHKNLGGAIALTALTILPEILEVIKD